MSLKINSIGNQQNYLSFQKNSPKQSQETQQEYENPVNKGWEYFSAVAPATLMSVLVGSAVGLIAKYGFSKSNKLSAGIGVGVGLAMAAWSIPTTLYHTSVNVFGKQKEMDVYSRAKTAEIKIAEGLDKSVQDDNLDQSIDRFAKYSYAKNGRGLGIMNMQNNNTAV